MNWVLANDHRGVSLKNSLKEVLEQHGHNVFDLGAHNENRVDAQDLADEAILKIKNGEAESGLLICGTGIMMSMRANRHKGIRAALLNDSLSAERAKQHNNANVVCFGADILNEETAKKILESFLRASFIDQDPRYKQRNDRLDDNL